MTMSLVLCLLIGAAGAGIVAVALMVRPEPSEAGVENRATKVPSVRIEVLKPTTVEDRVTLTGSVQAWEDVVVSAEITGKVEWKGVEEGQVVKAGQEMFKIDTEQIQARLDQARAQAKLAVQDHDRAQALKRKGAGTDQAVDGAVANKDVAQANVRMLEIQSAKSVVHAPFDGTLDKTFKEKDEFVDTGMPLAHVVQIHKVKVKVGIPERDVPFFNSGDKVRVTLDAIPGSEFRGAIRRVGCSADMMTHTFCAEIELDNPEHRFRPGMIARATLIRKAYPDSILAPIFATILLDQQRYAVVEEAGVARLRPVEIGVVQGGSVQITKGLAPGDHLIVAGQFDVRNGEPVQVQEGSM